MADQLEQKVTSSRTLLPAGHYKAFGLRMQGYTLEQVAEQTGYSYSYVRKIFARSGTLYQYWRQWVEEKHADVVEEALDMAFGNLPDAMRRHIVAGQNTRSMVGVVARQDIFAYTLGKPEQRLKLDARVGLFNFGDWAIQQAESIKAKQNGTERPGEIITELPEES